MLRALLGKSLRVSTNLARAIASRLGFELENGARSGGGSRASGVSSEQARAADANSEAQPPRRKAPTGPSARDVQITPEEIFALRGAGTNVVMVDVREPVETASGIVEGAMLIPTGSLASRLDELNPEDHIVLYCAAGMRSTNAALFMHGRGFAHVKSLVGGFPSWMHVNGAVAMPGSGRARN